MDEPVVYLSFAQEDSSAAREIYDRLSTLGFKPWMAQYDVRPGENWREQSAKTIRQAAYFLALLSQARENLEYAEPSRSVVRELYLALEEQHKSERGGVFIIPVRLEPCHPPSALDDLLWVDLFEADGWDRLVVALVPGQATMLPEVSPPSDLIDACRNGDCVLYAGAGLSAEAGLPVWQAFALGLLLWASERNFIDPSFARSLRTSIEGGETRYAVDSLIAACQTHQAEPALNTYLSSVFLPPDLPLTSRHDVLHQIPFAAAFTTNFDNLIERTFAVPAERLFTPIDTEPLLECLHKKDFFVAKLYGTLERPDTVLVSPKQYEDMVANNSAFAEFMDSLFISRTILFVGASIEGILDYLEGIRFGGQKRSHYALVAVSGTRWEAKAESLHRRYGIHVLPYPVSPMHQQVTQFLQQLHDAVRPTGSRRGIAHTSKPATSCIRRIMLQNIGCFKELELEMHPRWNILLGDNGVGKSTILRAVAAGLSGEDCRPYADRLRRFGTSRSSITIETSEGQEYFTDIIATSGETRVTAIPARLLQSESWLALGFPPLRMMNWDLSRSSADELPGRPHTRDVLPMISGLQDNRLDDLNQWILNNEYIIKDAGKGAERAQRLRQELFRVIGVLTRELQIAFSRCDPVQKIVYVHTDDGEVPIQAISQGMSSLFGWVGILVRRMFDVYDVDPLTQHAIVLIDEIDAHMHPRWQQSIIHDLSEIFPRVQFIVTTHSPLIVGGMPREQIFRFARNEEGGIEQVDVPDDMLVGRTDQILTGRLFDLPTTSDYKTQRLMQDYRTLLGKSNKTPEDERKLDQLADQLRARLPEPEEQPVQRRAIELIDALLERDVGDMPEAKEHLLNRCRKLFAEIEREQSHLR